MKLNAGFYLDVSISILHKVAIEIEKEVCFLILCFLKNKHTLFKKKTYFI